MDQQGQGSGSLAAVKVALTLLAALALALVGPVPVAEAAGKEPAFEGKVERVDAATRARMSGVSWRPGCPVDFAELRLLKVHHWGFDGRVHRGRLVVNRDAARGMLGVMRSLYRQRFPIRRMRWSMPTAPMITAA